MAYERWCTLRKLSSLTISQIIERSLRDRPYLPLTDEMKNYYAGYGYQNSREAQPRYFTSSVWSEGFRDANNSGRVVKAWDNQGMLHTCYNQYWIYDRSASRSQSVVAAHDDEISAKVAGQSCDCYPARFTAEQVLGLLETIDMELRLGQANTLERLFHIRLGPQSQIL